MSLPSIVDCLLAKDHRTIICTVTLELKNRDASDSVCRRDIITRNMFVANRGTGIANIFLETACW